MLRLRMDPTTKLLIRRGIKRGILTLKRERGYVASLGVLAGVVLLFQMFLALGGGIATIAEALRTHTDLRLELRAGTEDRTAQEFLVALQARPEVEEATLVTREQAYERERTVRPDLVAFLERFQIENPFPDTVAVTLSSLDSYDSFVEFIREPAWQQVVDAQFLSQATGQEQELKAMLRLTQAGQILANLFLGLVCLILVAVLMELTRRRSLQRRDEVFVERMAGAPELSVVVPFATEATILLLASIVVSIFVISVVVLLFPGAVAVLSDPGIFGELTKNWIGKVFTIGPVFIVLEIVLAPALGLLGAYLGTRGNTVTLARV